MKNDILLKTETMEKREDGCSVYQTRDAEPMLFYCWANVEDGGPTIKRHWVNVPCLLEILCWVVINP